MRTTTTTLLASLLAAAAAAHSGHDEFAAVRLASQPPALSAVPPPGNAALMASSFSPLKPSVRYYWDTNFFYVESDSMPRADLMPTPMVGITSWQQQLPITVGYFGNLINTESDTNSLGYGKPNIWRLPLVPVASTSPIPISAGNFQRGAIAIAANGIAIFNPRNNTGAVSYEIGELDAYGGHCGRADDYHYHIAPTHLTNVLGHATPIAWSLDGYPLYGYLEPDGTAQQALDVDGGHTNVTGSYHYHARGSAATGPQSPYLMAAFHGTVVNYGGQVDGQPTVGTVAPAGAPLPGGVITAFNRPAKDQYNLTYTLAGTNYTVAWQIDRIAHTVAVQFQTQTGAVNGVYSSTARFNYYPMAPASLLKLPDTGQTLDATPLFGEDSDYTNNPPSFTDNGDGTIKDNVTGLTWQKTDSGEMTWKAALTNAPASLGGFTDWRLPTAQEAFSILNHNQNPALDSTYFVNNAGGTPGYFWTSDLFYGDNSKVWAINTGGGLGPHPTNSTISGGGALRFHARYVRGALPTVGHNHVNNNDGTITDLDTGLMWSQLESSAMQWSNALTYAEGLVLAGYSDWRLPNVRELQSLEDITRATASTTNATACINRILFTNATAKGHWSSTTVKSGSYTAAWLVDFGVNTTSSPSRNQQGIVSYETYAANYPVFVVRGPVSTSVVTQIVVQQPAGTPLLDGVSVVNFGSVNVGSSSSRTFVISNAGTSTLTITGTTMDGANATNFVITSAPTNVVVVGTSTTMTVQFNSSVAGTHVANLHIASSDSSVGSAFDIGLQGFGYIPPPAITVIATSPNTPTYLDSVYITANIQAAPGATITVAQLSYDTGSLSTGTVFTETMATTGATNWPGTNADHVWTTVGGNTIKQTTGANHGTGNPCGLLFDKGTINLTDSMVATATDIGAAGSSGYVEFWVSAASLISPNGFTMQLSTNSGASWTTRVSELTGSNHVFQLYHYDLPASECVNTLRLRFQFAGYPATNPTPAPRLSLDDIKIAVVTGSPPVALAMYDDGLHGDGIAGDGIFGALIPVQTSNTTVNFSITAGDSNGSTSTVSGVSYSVNAATPLPITSAIAASIGGNITVQWNSQTSFSYSVQRSGDLNSWSNIPVGPTNGWTDSVTNPWLFYRVKR